MVWQQIPYPCCNKKSLWQEILLLLILALLLPVLRPRLNATSFSQWQSLVLFLFLFLNSAEISPLQGEGLICRNWTMRRRYIPNKPPSKLLLPFQCWMVPKCWIGSLDFIRITPVAKACTVWWVKQPNGFQNSTSDRCQQICCINEPHVISWFFLPEMETAHEWSLTFSLGLLAHRPKLLLHKNSSTSPHLSSQNPHNCTLVRKTSLLLFWLPWSKYSQLFYSLAVQHSPKSHVLRLFMWHISFTALPSCSP